jgi:TfoX/Sxy family transcriptional regulator of competence genes
MSTDDPLVQRVRSAMTRASRVEEKKMFGGITFMVDGKMCVSVARGRIMCRIDPAMHDAALQRKGTRTVIMKGREYRGYVHVDAEAVRTKRDLDYWVELALAHSVKAKSSKKGARSSK